MSVKFKTLSPDAQDAVIEILDELRSRIEWDKNHLKSLGHSIPRLKGHVRSMLFIDEMKSELTE